MAAKGKIFYGEASKGFILKVAIDTLCGPLQRGIFIIDKDGIRLRQSDLGNTVLYDINFARKHFRGYKCVKPLIISVNLKHMQNLLRNVKKKDSLALFIDPKYPEKFFITIRPEGARKNTRFETNSVVYQEEKDYKIEPLPDGGYAFPMVIEAADFQKIKRLTSIGKIINVIIQRDNYLSFKCDAGVVFDSELGFGELRTIEDDGEEDTKPHGGSRLPSSASSRKKCDGCGETKKNCYCECDGCGEYLCDCICTCNECNEWLCDCSCVCEECNEWLCDCTCKSTKAEDGYDEVDDEEIPGLFQAQYYSHILTKLVKLPGLCTQMQFYAPTIPCFPLRIEVNAGQGGFTLGTIQVFIKDVAQIAYEESLKNEEEAITTTKSTKGKGKMKKK